MERVEGIEPSWPAWKAGALPLSYTRSKQTKYFGGGSRIRTCVDIRRQIYSLLPLTARPSLQTTHTQSFSRNLKGEEYILQGIKDLRSSVNQESHSLSATS